MAAKEALITVLDKASSQDPSLIRLAEEKLKEWETNANFYKELLVITIASYSTVDSVLCLYYQHAT